MIEVRYRARLGNNLFQYALGRILAEELGWSLLAAAIPGFPGTTEKVIGASYSQPEQILDGQQIDLDTVLADTRVRRIILNGWFQRYEYYRPHQEKIRRWLSFDPEIELLGERPDVVLHVRRTDYIPSGWALPFSYYEAAIEHLSPLDGRIWIMTDDRRDPFFERFAKWRPHYLPGNALMQMAFMARAKRLVMSPSTFCWWATFLGEQDEVICPVPSFGLWATDGAANNVHLIEQDRFTCLPCLEPYRPFGEEARYHWWRLMKRKAIRRIRDHLKVPIPLPPP